MQTIVRALVIRLGILFLVVLLILWLSGCSPPQKAEPALDPPKEGETFIVPPQEHALMIRYTFFKNEVPLTENFHAVIPFEEIRTWPTYTKYHCTLQRDGATYIVELQRNSFFEDGVTPIIYAYFIFKTGPDTFSKIGPAISWHQMSFFMEYPEKLNLVIQTEELESAKYASGETIACTAHNR